MGLVSVGEDTLLYKEDPTFHEESTCRQKEERSERLPQCGLAMGTHHDDTAEGRQATLCLQTLQLRETS